MLKEIRKIITWFEEHYIVSWIITILLAISIFYISSQSFEKGVPGPDWPIKSYIYHAGIFFLFSFFFLISIIKGNIKKKHLFAIAILMAIAYGIADELHQLFVPNRDCTIEDALTDSIGILFAGIIYVVSFWWKKSKD